MVKTLSYCKYIYKKSNFSKSCYFIISKYWLIDVGFPHNIYCLNISSFSVEYKIYFHVSCWLNKNYSLLVSEHIHSIFSFEIMRIVMEQVGTSMIEWTPTSVYTSWILKWQNTKERFSVCYFHFGQKVMKVICDYYLILVHIYKMEYLILKVWMIDSLKSCPSWCQVTSSSIVSTFLTVLFVSLHNIVYHLHYILFYHLNNI